VSGGLDSGLWHVMRYLDYDDKIIRILESLYRNTMSAVRLDGGLSDWFPTVVGVLQSCVLSPLLFNILLEVVMMLALGQNDIGVCVNGSVISSLRFADDISLLSDSDHGLQLIVNKVNPSTNRFGLTMSLVKTEVQVVGRDTSQIEMHTKIGNSEVKQVQEFVYLGGTICSDATCDKDISRRTGIASGVARRFEKI